jgi:mannose-6-phosphate isomerase-like protein (cupin superfamily)
MTGRAVLAGAGEGQVYRVVGDHIRVLARGADTNGAYEIFELRGPPMHSHPWDEAYVLLEGEVEVTAGAQQMLATPGCFINIPRGMLHTFRVVSDEARFIVVTSPHGASDFFAELDREVGGALDDIPKILQVALRHGFSVPPPPA